jgi:hypothetical protein
VKTQNNKWNHGPAHFEIPELPVLSLFDGFIPVYLVLDSEVGKEVVLFLNDRTEFINTLKATKPFRLFVKTGVARNEYGSLGWLLFWIQNPSRPNDYVAAYDMYVNPTDDRQLQLWGDLAAQTHWHIFLVGASRQQEDFFEFENSYGLDEFLTTVRQACKDNPIIDYFKAREKFGRENSIRDLFKLSN